MDLIKQYIVQAISAASNNLRLSSEKIEVVAILREHLSKSADIGSQIQQMKKITSFSKFAIKLDDVYKYIANSKIDFLKISDRFKEHSHSLIRELSNLLDIVTPQDIREIIADLNQKEIKVDLSANKTNPESLENINVSVEKETKVKEKPVVKEETLKEDYIFEDLQEKEEIDFEEFEKAVLKPIKQIDVFLKDLQNMQVNEDELDKFIEIMEANTKLSEKVGFEIITNMHRIFTRALKLIKQNDITPVPDIVENMRACLIVIVAVVRQKDVNITGYLNRAEKFGKVLFSKKKV